MNPFANGMAETPIENIPVMLELEYLAHSALIGAVLMLLLVWTSQTSKKDGKSSSKDTKAMSSSEVLLNASNVLFLSFGMTGVMLLVNNNLARAFAIGAAIALVRFRVKFDSKSVGMSLFYALLTGMACGVGEVSTAYAIVGFYGVLQFCVVNAAKSIDAREKKSVIAEVPNQPIIVVEQKQLTEQKHAPSQPAMLDV
jgi:hypothetical protein